SFNLTTGTATAWNPNVSDVVTSLALSDGTLYVGGYFTQVNTSTTDLTRNRVAAFNLTDGTATDFNQNLDDVVNTLSLNGSSLFVGGNFQHTGQVNRNNLAAIDPITGEATDWD